MSATAEQTTWDEVIARDDIIGGQLEIEESDCPTRSFLTKIVRRGSTIRFEHDWTAHQPVPGRWEFFKAPFSAMINEEFGGKPSVERDGRITFGIHRVGPATIYPKGHPDLLDPGTIDDFLEP